MVIRDVQSIARCMRSGRSLWIGIVATAATLIVAIAPAAAAAQSATRPRAAPPARRAAPAPAAPTTANAVAALETQTAAAESALQAGETQIAESRYRDAMMQGWMLLGALEIADGRMTAARDAFRRAAASAVDARLAQRSLALVSLETGDAADAVILLTRLTAQSPDDARLRRLLAQALVASGQIDQAVQELEEARASLPGDLELAFMLASGYLRQNKTGAAAKIFDEIASARPGAETDVLIGRMYRDFGDFARARTSLQRALNKNPRVRRAHYYLGTVTIMDEGFVKLDEAVREFRQELALAPRDPVTNLRLGIVLEEARDHQAALPALEIAAADPTGGSEAFEYLGRCQLALGRTKAGVVSLQRALELSGNTAIGSSRIGRLHYQLASALRSLGREEEATTHFREAERSSAARTETSREQLARYLAGAMESDSPGDVRPLLAAIGPRPFGAASAADRASMKRRVAEALARAYLNLGIMHARASRFGRAATFFEQAADASPDFPQVQYSLGVAYFNAEQYEKAVTPLERASTADPQNAEIRRMLAVACLNAEQFERAATLLRADPARDSDPSLQYVYGLALVRGGRAAEAEREFSRLLASHGDSPELNVVLGQAYAQQGDNEQAIAALKRALRARPDVAEANTTLGIIYMRQGQLEAAEAALRAELDVHPSDVRARHTLGAVLEMLNRPVEAIAELRRVVTAKPTMADARYLLGKILLAQGDAEAASHELEAGARLAPDDANIHFQLAQAYQKTGRRELAQQEFERYRQLKDKRREAGR